MKDSELYDKIFDLHDQAISRLRSLRIPPFPKHYKKHFDDIFQEEADAKLKSCRSAEEARREGADELAQYLDLAHKAIMAFAESHNDISHVAEMQQHFLEGLSENSMDRCVTLVSELSALGQGMTDELKKAQEKIDRLSRELQEAIAATTTDPLTQVGNRKGFMDDLDKMLEAGEQKQLPLVLMMIDADNFKLLNDEYGHLAGDKVLYFLAQSIKSMIRGGDRVYRFGGEEFAVILNRCDPDQVFEIADKIRTRIEQSHLIYSGKTIRMTVSVGVTVHRRGDTYETILERADDALYRAKKSRKNCTIIFDS